MKYNYTYELYLEDDFDGIVTAGILKQVIL